MDVRLRECGSRYSPFVRPEPAGDLSFHEPVRRWFASTFEEPTPAQRLGWPPISRGVSTLLLAPTGSGKTLAAFLAGLDRLFFEAVPPSAERLRLLYVSPLKALGVDVEKNLMGPIAGIRATCEKLRIAHEVPTVGVRTGDTPARERARLLREPPDVLITTPESLYLLLTSRAAERLRTVRTVIIDEIHALAATKRGAHLWLSLERLESLRGTTHGPLQRIGLSATVRPLDGVARLLGGGEVSSEGWIPRPVETVDAGSSRVLDLCVEVPEDSTLLEVPAQLQGEGSRPRSAWSAIVPRLVELVRAHRSTMLFVNSRRLAERLSGEINERAGEELALAHHGSIAKDRRAEIEGLLKSGQLRAIVATSSLELGIDMGTVDLVIQIGAPPSVAAGLQRVGRAGHGVGRPSRGIVFPKHRGELLACATVMARMLAGMVEETPCPRNPLDVLVQQLVAMTSMRVWRTDELYALVRRAAPFADLERSIFDGILELLSGRYPSDDFASLKPRIVFDRRTGTVSGRGHARRLAVLSGGTIPDRGLYGVFLADEASRVARRVGELDEEMVFESKVGDVFLLGASAWRIETITHDRVLVSPAPGEPARMPFWKGDAPGRSVELGAAIGALARDLITLSTDQAQARLVTAHALGCDAALALTRYLVDQRDGGSEVPTDRTIVVERLIDEMGDYRVCLLSPFGARVHLPWAMAVTADARARGIEVDQVVTDDGIVWRFPETESPPDLSWLFPDPASIEENVIRLLPGTPLFSARFRENASRALMLPRHRPNRRQPLWAQRKRARDLLSVAARFPDFPIMLETLRECLRDDFDMPALRLLLEQIRERTIRVVSVDAVRPSPFASSLLFGYVGNFLYEGDAPLGERRLRALSIDQDQLRAVLGEGERRALLDVDAISEVERSLMAAYWQLECADDIHDLLLRLGHQSMGELAARVADRAALEVWCRALIEAGRIVPLEVVGRKVLVAVEDAARYRDALGVALPEGLAEVWLAPVAYPLGDLLGRYARTRGPFTVGQVVTDLGMPPATVGLGLEWLAERGRVVSGEFLPGGEGEEWCDVEVLRRIKRASLAAHRAAISPVDPEVFAAFVLEWQHLESPLAGPQGLLEVVAQLEGAPLIASTLDDDVLSARVNQYRANDLDLLCAQGLVRWRGLERIGGRDGRIALYTSSNYELLAPTTTRADGPLPEALRTELGRRGALFFPDLARAVGGSEQEVLEALWALVWAGEVTNDTMVPLRSFLARGIGVRPSRPTRAGFGRFGSLGAGVRPGSEGRWSLLPTVAPAAAGAGSALEAVRYGVERRTAVARSLLERYGVLVREAATAEAVEGGFSFIYPVLRHLEESGQLRRGWFVAKAGTAQFALPGTEDRLRARRSESPGEDARFHVLAGADPANVYGALFPWPEGDADARLSRAAGTVVVLEHGRLRAHLSVSGGSLSTFGIEAGCGPGALGLATSLAAHIERRKGRAVLITRIDGLPARSSPFADALRAVGFVGTPKGLYKSRRRG